MRFGAGVKSKLLASLAAGVPCVASPIGAEGIVLPAALSSAIGATAESLARQIVRLHTDLDANRTAAAAGLAMIGLDFAEARVDAALQAAIDGRSQPAAAALPIPLMRADTATGGQGPDGRHDPTPHADPWRTGTGDRRSA
jgi:hypothetical protein